jgi:ArsR family transcriptional regulator
MTNTNQKVNIDMASMERTAIVFKAIAHPTRLAVLELLVATGQMNVNELMSATNCEQSLLSHHLANMRSSGLLKSERKGQMIFYSLKDEKAKEIALCVEKHKA